MTIASSLDQVEAQSERAPPNPQGCGGPRAVPSPLRRWSFPGEFLSMEPGCAVIPKGKQRHRAGSE